MKAILKQNYDAFWDAEDEKEEEDKEQEVVEEVKTEATKDAFLGCRRRRTYQRNSRSLY